MTVLAESRSAFAHHRGGGPYTRSVSQRLGSVAAAVSVRLRWTPDALTTANLVVGLGGCLVAAEVRGVVGGLVAALLWQLAYACDCADGQLARWKRMGTAHGKAYDLLCDYVVQLAFATVVLARSGRHSAHVVIPVAGLFLLGTFFAGLADEHLVRDDGDGPRPQRSGLGAALVFVSRALRDYGLITLVVGVGLCFPTQTPLVVLGAAGTMNLVATAARVAPVLSFRAARTTPTHTPTAMSAPATAPHQRVGR